MSEKTTKLIVGFIAFVIFGGLTAWGLFSAKDSFVQWQAEVKKNKQDIATTQQKCEELCGEVVKYIEANKDNENLKTDHAAAAKAVFFIVQDEQDAWGNTFALNISEKAVTVVSQGPTESEEDDVSVSIEIELPQKSMWQRAIGFFK